MFEDVVMGQVDDAVGLRAALQAMADLNPELQEALTLIAREITYPAGERIFDEGDAFDGLYLIQSGILSVFRPARDGQPEYHVTELGPGKPLGELALIDGEPRSLSARAKTDCRLAFIDTAELLALPEGERLLADLKGSLSIAIVRRMRESTDNYVQVLEGNLARAREQQQFGRFFIYVLVMMSIGTLVNDVIARNIVEIDIYTDLFAWQYLAILMLPSLIIIHRMGIPWRDLGFTIEGLRRSLLEGAGLSLLALVIILGLATTLRALELLPGKPIPFEFFSTLAYILHALLQEMVGRGLLLSSFQRFLNDRSGLRSNLLASFLFSLFHLHYGLSAVAMVYISGLVFGAIYLRHRNLAGVSLVHVTIGVGGFYAGLM